MEDKDREYKNVVGLNKAETFIWYRTTMSFLIYSLLTEG